MIKPSCAGVVLVAVTQRRTTPYQEVFHSMAGRSQECAGIQKLQFSGFRRNVDEICGLLGYYAASCGNCSPTCRDNVSVASSRVKRRLLTREDPRRPQISQL
jgi:hypothetical protein